MKMVAVIIVCHGGEIEIKTSFLVYTLRKFLKGKFRIYIAMPDSDDLLPPVRETTLRYFKKENVEIRRFHNKLLQQSEEGLSGDFTSNKIYALQDSFNEENLLFLDSDIALMQNLDIKHLQTEPGTVLLSPANRANVTKWQKIYEWAKLPYPTNRITTTIDHVALPPYYNSGVISMHSNNREQLYACWEKFMRKISDRNTIISLAIPVFHRDQIALSLALQQHEIKVENLPETLNFPLRSKLKTPADAIYLAHYHTPQVVYENRALRQLLRDFLLKHSEFRELSSSYPVWKQLFHYHPFITYCLAKLRWVKMFLTNN